MLRTVVLTQYRRVTDRQTDGIAVASTALAVRALRRAVKMPHRIHPNTPLQANFFPGEGPSPLPRPFPPVDPTRDLNQAFWVLFYIPQYSSQIYTYGSTGNQYTFGL